MFLLLIVALAYGLRQRAVQMLPPDYDEDDYLRAGQLYAQGIRAGDWGVFTRENYRAEHPPLSKILYGFVLLSQPEFPLLPDRPTTAGPDANLPKGPLQAARSSSALFSVLQTGITALVNPLAGFFVAINTFNIKYTSQVMLEGIPSLTSLLVVLGYLQWRRRGKSGWLALSAVSLGLTAAAKYYFAVAGLAVAAHWVWTELRHEDHPWKHWQRWLPALAAWSAGAVAVFFLADPYLWPDPIGRLISSVTYHGGYAQSAAVREANFPFWQPLVWLSMSVPWHPDVFIFQFDILIALFALLGITRSRQQHPLFLLWLGLALAFLLVWPTKWPQYVLMLTTPLSIVAADGFQASIIDPLRERRARRERKQGQAAALTGHAAYRRWSQILPWILPGLIALVLITIFPLIYQFAMAMTDFRASAIVDGINGGVWREVWRGVTGQVEPRQVNVFDSNSGRQVHYTGLYGLIGVLFGVGDLYVFELIWTVLAVATQAGLGVAVALLLHRQGVRLKKLWQTLFILPWAVPEFVAALTWSQIFEPRFGFLSLAAKSWGQSAPQMAQASGGWQNNPNYALLVLLVAGLWYGFPFMLLSARAGLKLVPDEVYEAAALDGASGWRLFRSITWPLIFPLLLPAIILRAIFAFNQFYLFTVLQTPVITLSALSYYIFSNGRYAASALINVVTVIILVGLVLWFNRLTKATEGVGYA